MRSKACQLGLSVLALLGAAVLVVPAGQARTQQQQDTTVQSASPKQKPKPHILKFKGEVISANSASISLRQQDNPGQIQTFTYSPQVRDKMIALLQKGGYQPGDKVTISYEAGTTVARSISGKPSRQR